MGQTKSLVQSVIFLFGLLSVILVVLWLTVGTSSNGTDGSWKKAKPPIVLPFTPAPSPTLPPVKSSGSRPRTVSIAPTMQPAAVNEQSTATMPTIHPTPPSDNEDDDDVEDDDTNDGDDDDDDADSDENE